MLKTLSKVGSAIKIISLFVARILMAFTAFIMFLQVVLRFIFNAALPWPEEAVRYGMIWVALLVGNVLIRDKELISVDFLDHLWPPKVKRYRDFLYRLLLLLLLALVFKEGLSQAINGWKATTTALEIRWFWPYLAIPIGMLFMLIQMLILIIGDFANSRTLGSKQ